MWCASVKLYVFTIILQASYCGNLSGALTGPVSVINNMPIWKSLCPACDLDIRQLIQLVGS